jgi:hypothetical protein
MLNFPVPDGLLELGEGFGSEEATTVSLSTHGQGGSNLRFWKITSLIPDFKTCTRFCGGILAKFEIRLSGYMERFLNPTPLTSS